MPSDGLCILFANGVGSHFMGVFPNHENKGKPMIDFWNTSGFRAASHEFWTNPSVRSFRVFMSEI